MFKDLNSFIAELDQRRELSRITEPVDPKLEISAVVDAASKLPAGGLGKEKSADPLWGSKACGTSTSERQ